MRIEFAAPSGLDTDDRANNSARLLNMFREDAGAKVVVKSMLGTELFCDLPGVLCRAMKRVDDVLYVAQGARLYKVTADGAYQELGVILDSEKTTIEGNNGKVTVAAGGRYYVWDGTSLTSPATGNISKVASVDFFGQLTVLVEEGGRQVVWSDPALPETINGLSFATTESRDDKNVRGISIGSEFWVFKERSIEFWYQNGADMAARPGATLDRGLKAFSLAAEIPGGVFYVANDNRCYVGNTPVSGRAVETAIEQGQPDTAFYFEDEGNKFCVLRFRDRPAWCFNIRSGEWCERAEGNRLGEWSAVKCAAVYDGYYVGTTTGNILKLTRNGVDNSGELVRRIVSATTEGGGIFFTIGKLEVNARVGWFETEPQLTMRMSGDYGHTWHVDRQVGMGALGDFLHRVIFRRLGRYRQATLELTVSDPVDVTFDSVLEV